MKFGSEVPWDCTEDGGGREGGGRELKQQAMRWPLSCLTSFYSWVYGASGGGGRGPDMEFTNNASTEYFYSVTGGFPRIRRAELMLLFKLHAFYSLK